MLVHPKASRGQSKEVKDMNIDELADLIVMRLNPQSKSVAHRDTHGDETWYGAVYVQGIILRTSAQG